MIIIIILASNLFYPLIKTNQDDLITMTILNEENNIGNYFNNSVSLISESNNMIWKIQLFNGLNEVKYYLIKIKIVNLNESSPDITFLTPTNATSVYQIHKFLGPLEETEIPFSWKIFDIKSNSREIKSVTINKDTIPLNLKMDSNLRVKIIFELWQYNTDTQQFEFKLLIGDKYTCIWNQISFIVNLYQS
jgi:hypothetical protein